MFADLRPSPARLTPAGDCDSWQQVRTLISGLEKVVSFGVLLYLNSLIYCLLYLPLLAFLRLQSFGPDIIRLSLMCVGCAALYSTANEGRLYHDLKGQDFIKLSAFYTILIVSNSLMRILGKRLMLNLHGCGRGLGWSNWAMAGVYVVAHSAVLYCQLIVIHVTLQSSLATSALLFFTTYFFRLKSSVFKKMDKRLLFNLLCQDISERLEFSVFLLLLCLKATLESQDDTQELWVASFCLLGLWMLVDWMKYYFLTYLNRTPESIFVLDFYTKLQKQNLRNAIETGCYMDYWTETKTEALLDAYNSLSLSYRFPCIPLACVVPATQVLITLVPVALSILEAGDCGLCLLALLLAKCGIMKILNHLVSR